jgi:UDP-N-acetylglucosamine 3-dehydrogenase
MTQVRIGVIGCGGIAHAAHLPHYVKLDNAELVAVADVAEDAARKTAEEFGAKDSYTDYRDLLKRDDIDAVSVTTPPKWHSEIAVAAARAGKHVLVEKPMARNVDEADAMVSAAKEAGVLLMATHQDRMGPMSEKVKELIDHGVIGKPYEIASVGGSWHMVGSPWFYDKDIAGGGVGMDGLIYTAYMWTYWMGKVKSVYALTDTFVKKHPVYEWHSDAEDDVTVTATPEMTVEDSLAILMRFENGAAGIVYSSWVSPTSHGYCEILGSDGLIMPNGRNGEGPQVYVSNDVAGLKKGWNPIETPDGDPYFGRIAHFVDCIRNGTTPITTGEEATAAVELIQAAYLSATHRKPFNLPLERNKT